MISIQDRVLSEPFFQTVRSWVQTHPITVKICVIAGVILGSGLLLSAPCALALGIGPAIGLAVTGLVILVASLLLGSISAPENHLIVKEDSPSPEALQATWQNLEQRTEEKLHDLKFVPPLLIAQRFTDINCPQETALMVNGTYLHANRIGEGLSERFFIASQAPLKQDAEKFWLAVADKKCMIFDLTTLEDRKSGGVASYAPMNLERSLSFGSITISLTGYEGRLSTYRLINRHTHSSQDVQRYHFPDWQDFSALSLSKLVELIEAVETLVPKNQTIWVHCRAGVGRTGTLITALILKEKIEKGVMTQDNFDSSLIDMILTLRAQRGPGFVQQEAQFDLLRLYGHSLLNR